MLKLNGYIVEQNRFPDCSLNLKIDSISHFIKNENEFNEICWCYDNDSEIFSLMCIVDIVRRNSDKKINLYIPYLINSRMDRIKSKNENFSLKVFCNWLNSLNFNKIITYNVHSNVSEALINNVESILPNDDVDKAIYLYSPDVIFFPDEGACKRYSDLEAIKKYNKPVSFGIKKRDWKTGKILGLEVVSDVDLKDKSVLIVDDICSAGGTFKFSAIKLKEMGAEDVALYISHCEDNIKNGDLLTHDYVSKIYTTDSILHISDPKIEIINTFRK